MAIAAPFSVVESREDCGSMAGFCFVNGAFDDGAGWLLRLLTLLMIVGPFLVTKKERSSKGVTRDTEAHTSELCFHIVHMLKKRLPSLRATLVLLLCAAPIAVHCTRALSKYKPVFEI
jgi:hypothetical protein